MKQDTLIAETMEEKAKRLETYETPEWVVRAILEREILTRHVVDPCAGRGVMGRVAGEYGYILEQYDFADWGNGGVIAGRDFLGADWPPQDFLQGASVIMNPPFSRACDFVRRSFDLGARKIVCFQRFAWWESAERRDFWCAFPPNRVYICGERATCWRFDLADAGRGGNTPTAHAWYVWEAGHPGGTQLGHIYKNDATNGVGLL
mgnify:CR=1 FL=1